jgi:hypothetical protein
MLRPLQPLIKALLQEDSEDRAEPLCNDAQTQVCQPDVQVIVATLQIGHKHRRRRDTQP